MTRRRPTPVDLARPVRHARWHRQDLDRDQTAWAMDRDHERRRRRRRRSPRSSSALQTKGETVGELTGAGRHDARARRPHRAFPAGRSTSSAPAATGRTRSTSRRWPRSSSPAPGSRWSSTATAPRRRRPARPTCSRRWASGSTSRPPRVAELATEVGITFCFAQVFHPSFRHAGRRAQRSSASATAFNFLGPLTNPAQPRSAAIGVADAPDGPAAWPASSPDAAPARWCSAARTGSTRSPPPARPAIWEVRDGGVASRSIDWATDLGVARITAGVAARRRRPTTTPTSPAGCSTASRGRCARRSCSTPRPRWSRTARPGLATARSTSGCGAASARGRAGRGAPRTAGRCGAPAALVEPLGAAASAVLAGRPSAQPRGLRQSSSPRANACSRSCCEYVRNAM